MPLGDRTRANAWVLLAISLTLAGCGFHLRGTSTVPNAIQPLALSCAADLPEQLCKAIRNQLELSGVRQSDTETAAAILEVRSFQQDRRANAVTAQAAAAEYTLRQSVTITAKTGNQVPLFVEETVNSAETYRYDETNVLAKQREEDQLQKELSQRLAQQILFRLAPLNQTRVDALVQQNSPTDSAAKP